MRIYFKIIENLQSFNKGSLAERTDRCNKIFEYKFILSRKADFRQRRHES